MSETAAETKKSLKQLTKAMSPKKGTSKQENEGDEVEDKRKMAPMVETVTSNKTSPSSFDETSEPTESHPVEQEETKLTQSHRDVMLSTMEQGLDTQCHKLKANRFELQQLIAEKGDTAKSKQLKKLVENRPKIVKNSNKV